VTSLRVEQPSSLEELLLARLIPTSIAIISYLLERSHETRWPDSLAVAQGILLGMLSMSPTIQYGLILVIKQEPLFTTLEWQFATGQS
jgi:hypothetical protein